MSVRRSAVPWTARTATQLTLFWIVLSGHFEALFLVLGALSVAVVCWLCWRAGAVERSASWPLVLRVPRYLLWLGKEVLVSSVAVVRKVWSPRPALRPAVAVTPSPDLSALSQVIYANSITLTPGTLSLDVEEDRIKVHSLEVADIEALRDGAMLGRVRRLEGRR